MDRRRHHLNHVLGGTALLPLALWPLNGYLAALTAAASAADRRPGGALEPPSAPPTTLEPATNFTVLVPAHDEERHIGDAIRSVLEACPPPGDVRLVVVADHCTDGTVDIARSLGATVIEHVDPRPRGKSAALRWALDRLGSAAGDDVVVVIDADSVVDQDFFRALHERFARGARVVQANYAVRELAVHDTSHVPDLVRLRAAALALRHYVRPLGRSALGGSSGLFGNGMAFAPTTLDTPWGDHLTEDVELQVRLLLRGVTVTFAGDALVRAVMPADLAGSRSQHERWERGRLDLARRYVPALVLAAAGARGARRRELLDAALDLLVPPLSVLGAATAGAVVWSSLVAAVAPGGTTRIARAGSWSMLAMLAAHVLGGLVLARTPATTYRAMIGAPRLVAWKVALWARMVATHDVAWVRTERGGTTAVAA